MSDDDVLIKVENVSKKFCKSLKQSMLYGIEDIARDTLNLKATSDVLRKDEFWAVDDVSFEVKRGECLGIIGRNGAGKSTLLKMLNGIFMPDKGTITIKGKVGALIEVGAGFHPMLTGRENIYVNGSILGMSKREIDGKFDEIVEFAELEEFIDMPVKHYSSGMYVRLGFAIAAQVEPDVLILDEVLAVGDLGFSAKCYKYISDFKRKSAVILVSHDMRNISRMSNVGLFFSKGKVISYGDIQNTVELYRSYFSENDIKRTKHDSEILTVLSVNSLPKNRVKQYSDLVIEISLYSHIKNINIIFNMAIHKSDGTHCCGFISDPKKITNISKNSSKINIDLYLSKLRLMPGEYYFSLYIWNVDQTERFSAFENCHKITVIGDERTQGIVTLEHKWKIK